MSRRDAHPGPAAVKAASVGIRTGDVYSVVEESSASLVRVLFVDVERGQIVLLALGERRAPFIELRDSVAERIAGGRLSWTDDHSFRRLLPPPVRVEQVVDRFSKVVAPRNAPRSRPAETALIARHRLLIAPLMAAAASGTLFGETYCRQVSDCASHSNASRATVARVLTTWLECGMVDAALGSLRRNCGGRGKLKEWTGVAPGRRAAGKRPGLALTPFVRHALDWAVNWLRVNERKPKIDGYNKMIAEFFSEGTRHVGEVELPAPVEEHLRPTERQFDRYVRKMLPDFERKRRRRGARHYRSNVAPVFETTSDRSFGPGSMAHLDTSPMPFNVVDQATRTIDLGQVRLCFVIDDFSSMILGRHGWIGSETSQCILLAVADSMVGEHRAPRATRGRSHSNVRKFMTKEGFTDKGTGNLSEHSNSVYERLGASVANPPAGTPQKRGKGEQRFNMAKAFTDHLEGAIDKRRRGRGDRKRGGDANLTLDEYMEIVDEFILLHNSTHRPEHAPVEARLPDGRNRTAFELMLWGFEHRGAPDRCDEEHVRLCLYEQVVATVDGNRRGLTFDGLFYEPLGPVQGLRLEKTGRVGAGAWVILRDRDRLDTAWLLVDDGARSVPLRLTEQSKAFRELTAGEYDALRRQRRKAEQIGRDEFLAQRAASSAVVDGVRRKARALQRPSGSRLRKGTAEDKAREAERLRQGDVERLLSLAPPRPEAPEPCPSAPSNVPRPVALPPPTAAIPPPSSDVDDFRALRRRMLDKEAS